jgi:hypothetical protein
MSEVEVSNPIEDLVQHALDQDYNKANQVFGDLMGQKLNDILDQKKVEVAGQIYNDIDPEDEEDYEDDETDAAEELDSDEELEDDDESDSEEEYDDDTEEDDEEKDV